MSHEKKPSAGAMRAAVAIGTKYGCCPTREDGIHIAQIIEEETDLPGLLSICELICLHIWPRGHRSHLHRLASAALAKERGEEELCRC